MRNLLKTAAVSLIGLAMAGCYFESKTNLVPPDLRLDPFGDADGYIIPEQDGSPSNEALVRLPDGGFLSIETGAPLSLNDTVTRYDFALIDDVQWPPIAEEVLPGAPYVASMCEVEPFDAVNGCWIYMIFVNKDGDVTSVTPTQPEDGPESVELTSFEEAAAALRDAWRAGEVDAEHMPAFEPLTDARAEELGFQQPRFD